MKQSLTASLIPKLAYSSLALLLMSSCEKNDPEDQLPQWTIAASYPKTSDSNSPVFVLQNKAYVISNDTYVYDPEYDTWTEMARIPEAGCFESAIAFSINGKGYVGTGGETIYTKKFWSYDPIENNWTKMSNFGGTSRYESVAFSLNGKGYVMGGHDATIYTGDSTNLTLSDFWEYDPIKNKWTEKDPFPGPGRRSAVAFTINGKGYVGTGMYASRLNGLSAWNFLNDFWEYDPDTDSWNQMADFPGEARYEAVGYSSDGYGYIGTGFIGSNNMPTDIWEYDPVSNQWREIEKMSENRRYGAFGFSIHDAAYIGGGSMDWGVEKDSIGTYLWKYDQPIP